MAGTRVATRPNELYETDFYAWTQQQAELLRQKRFDDLDLENLIDEVASVGRSDKHQIRNRMSVLIAHLLKWKFQPGARTPSWRRTIRDQRDAIVAVLNDSPSLKKLPGEIFDQCYRSGRMRASEETGIDFTLFPEQNPFTIEQVLDETYWPKEPDLYDQS